MDDISSEGNKLLPGYIAFFDLDQTITSEISGKALIRMAWRNGHISLSDIVKAFYLYILYKFSLRDPLKVINDMVASVKGRSETWLESLCAEVCREKLLPSIFSEAIDAINYHKGNNAKVVILSSALNQICRPVSEFLGMDDFICSSLEVKGGYLTGEPVGRLCFGEEKLTRFTEYCKKNTMNPSESWYYGDSFSDLPVLQSVGNPVCVNPDRKLKKEAHMRGWKVLSWNN